MTSPGGDTSLRICITTIRRWSRKATYQTLPYRTMIYDDDYLLKRRKIRIPKYINIVESTLNRNRTAI